MKETGKSAELCLIVPVDSKIRKTAIHHLPHFCGELRGGCKKAFNAILHPWDEHMIMTHAIDIARKWGCGGFVGPVESVLLHLRKLSIWGTCWTLWDSEGDSGIIKLL
jgi:hypothetical protein